MPHGFYKLMPDELPHRRPATAGILIGLHRAVIALDRDRDEFVRLPDVRRDPDHHLMCLHPEGTEVVLLTDYAGRRFGGLCRYNVATGERRWLAVPPGDQYRFAAFSPDGRHLAALGDTTIGPDADDRWTSDVLVDVIQVETGQRQRLWSGPGGHHGTGGIGWSPDGRLIAGTYLTLDENSTTVVLDVHGTTVTHLPDTMVLPTPNGTWLNDHELLLADWDLRLCAADPTTRQTRILAEPSHPPLAVIGDRLIQSGELRASEPMRLSTLRLDGSDPRPFIELNPPQGIPFFDTAR